MRREVYTNSFLRTTCHELSHSVGETRALHLAQQESTISKNFFALTEELCKKHPLGCSDTWKKIKADLQGEKNSLKGLDGYKSEAPNLRACLQYQKPIDDPEKLKSVAARKAETRARRRSSELSGKRFFLNSVKPTTILEDGSEVEYLGYLDPCNGKKENPYSIEDAIPVFYLAEYQCNTNPDLEAKLQDSVRVPEAAQKAIHEMLIPLGGQFSRDSEMIDAGLASDSEERFADWMGSRVLARVIRNQNLDQKSKMNEIAFNLADFCDPPSNAVRYADEAQAEKELNNAPHSLKSTRRKEILTKPLRDALGCTSSATTKECSL